MSAACSALVDLTLARVSSGASMTKILSRTRNVASPQVSRSSASGSPSAIRRTSAPVTSSAKCELGADARGAGPLEGQGGGHGVLEGQPVRLEQRYLVRGLAAGLLAEDDLAKLG